MNFFAGRTSFSPSTSGIVGKSSWGMLFKRIVLDFVFTERFPLMSSNDTLESPERTENNEDNMSPRIATTPSFSTFASTSTSIPILKFVDRNFNVLSVARKSTAPKTGSVRFFPVILSTVLNACRIFSIEHSSFIISL